MFVRALFILLLALNIGGASWLLFAPRTPPEPERATDPGVARLVLLSERDGSRPDPTELAAAPESAADLARDECRRLGPFPTQADTRSAMAVLTPLTKRIRTRETRATQTRGYWVFLPAMASREEALGVARQLSGKGVRDYYVVTAGEQQNTVSLGLFRDQGNAERRRAEIAALGLQPEIATRTEDLPQYWLDFALAGSEPPDLATVAGAPRDARVETIPCF